MMIALIEQLGSWSWWIFGLVLLILEILAPGTFFLWFGVAAIIVGALSLIAGSGLEWWSWQIQIIFFVILSLILAVFGRLFMQLRPSNIHNSGYLSQRGKQLIGRIAILEEAIIGGSGRVRLDDTIWLASGPDLPVGTKIKIVGANLSRLQIESVDEHPH